MSAGPLPPLLLRGKAEEQLRRIPDESVDAIVTDPPYGLEFMGKEWDGADGFRRSLNAADTGRDNVFGRASRTSPEYRAGHLFQEWCEAWAAECLRILKPGGHLLAFGGSRTWHRLAAGIEDAGFEIRDSIAWLYGSGFPKSLDVSKAIDKLDAAAVRLERAREFQSWLRQYMTPKAVNEATGTDMGHHLTTHPTQPAVATAPIFDMLRPHLPEVPEAIELLAAERTVESENYARRGSTGVHEKVAGVSEWRAKYEGRKVAPVAEKKDVPHTPEAEAWQGWGTALKPAFEPIVVARKPLPYRRTVAANVLEHGTGALNIDATRIGEEVRVNAPASSLGNGVNMEDGKAQAGRESTIATGRWPANVALDESQAAALDEQSGASRFFYVAKAPKSERPVVDGTAHPTVKPLALMRWLLRLVTPPGGCVVDPFAGSGTTLEAAYLEGFEAIGCEMTPEYWPLVAARIERVTR